MLVRRGESGLLIPSPGIQVARVTPGTAESYSDRVKNTQNASLVGHWRINEPSGTVIDNYEGTAARDGTLAGVTLAQTGIGDGETSGSWDATDDTIDIYSSSLNTAWAQGQSTVMIWTKVSGSGVWTDGAVRYMWRLFVDGSNQIYLRRSSTNNAINAFCNAGGTGGFASVTGLSITDWMCWIMTVDEAADVMTIYLDGVSQNTVAVTGTWAGNLGSNNTLIGAVRLSTVADVWDGFAAHCAVWTTVLSSSEITDLSTV